MERSGNRKDEVWEIIMKKLAEVCAWAGIAGAVIGGISRLLVTPIILPSRGWAGFAVILILFSIALTQIYKK